MSIGFKHRPKGLSGASLDEAFVARYLHGRDPIGAHFGDSDRSSTAMFTIVGVVENAQYWPPSDPQERSHPMYFVSAWQWPQLPASNPYAARYAKFRADTHYMSSIEIETRGNLPGLEGNLTTALQQLNPNLMITDFESFAHQVNAGFSQQQMIVRLTSLFGLVALALAAIGLYGVTAYAVAQQTSEIGIRMALGANRLDVQKMVLRSAFFEVALGLLLGIPAAVAAGHLMAGELFGVKEWNPLILGTTTAVLGVVALVAAALPARKAARVEPMTALRGQ